VGFPLLSLKALIIIHGNGILVRAPKERDGTNPTAPTFCARMNRDSYAQYYTLKVGFPLLSLKALIIIYGNVILVHAPKERDGTNPTAPTQL